MNATSLFAANLLSPYVLAFLLGVVAKRIGSDLSLPKPVYDGIAIYLLFAIGLKGGARLADASLAALWLPAVGSILLGVLTPGVAFVIARRLGGLSGADAGALAAHYGSVSAVTFIAAQTLVQAEGGTIEPFLPTLLALLEGPGLIVGLALGRRGGSQTGQGLGEVLKEVVLGRTLFLLLGGLLVGAAIGPKGMAPVSPFFEGLFPGILTLFLLEMGVVAGERLSDLRRVGGFLVGFGTLVPLLHGLAGAALGLATGLTPGGAAVLGALAASASYIAAPPAVRLSLPEANPTYYLTASLAITFPFNLVVGIPIYYRFATWLAERMG